MLGEVDAMLLEPIDALDLEGYQVEARSKVSIWVEVLP